MLSLVALAFWLPATQHCALEEAGVFALTCSDHSSTTESTDKDGCGNVENAIYKATSNTLKVPAPGLLACARFLCLRHLSFAEAGAQAMLPKVSSRQPQVWVVIWDFVRRTAPLPGAPSSLTA